MAADDLCLAGHPNSKSCLLWQAAAMAGCSITIPSWFFRKAVPHPVFPLTPQEHYASGFPELTDK